MQTFDPFAPFAPFLRFTFFVLHCSTIASIVMWNEHEISKIKTIAKAHVVLFRVTFFLWKGFWKQEAGPDWFYIVLILWVLVVLNIIKYRDVTKYFQKSRGINNHQINTLLWINNFILIRWYKITRLCGKTIISSIQIVIVKSIKPIVGW